MTLPSHTEVKPVWLLGVPVHPVSKSQALEAAREIIEQSERAELIVTADASAIVLARQDPEFRSIIKSAALVTADGIGVMKALKMIGVEIKDRVCGVDMVGDISGMAAQFGWRVFLLGAAPDVADKAAEELVRRYPGLTIAGCQNGYFKFDGPVVEKIRDSKADILFIAMGMPRQEKWFWQYREQLGVKLAIGVGGTFDVLSGTVKRAPGFFQKYGLEWLYRFISNPRRRNKLPMLPVFALLAIREARRRKRLAKKLANRSK